MFKPEQQSGVWYPFKMATTKIVLFTSKVLNNGESPILMRVIHKRKINYISLGYACQVEQWNKEACRLRRNFRGYQAKNRVLASLEDRAQGILDEMKRLNKPFTFPLFEEQFRGDTKSCTVYEFFELRIGEIHKSNTKRTYRQTKNALFKFAPNTHLMFADINYPFLKKFETHLLNNGMSGGGVHFYMRTLRAVVNEAINRGYFKRELYPFANQFNKNGYSIGHLNSVASPRALSEADMERIKAFPVEQYPHLKKSVQYFLFSYYARGINFTDMAQLRWTDLYNGRL